VLAFVCILCPRRPEVLFILALTVFSAFWWLGEVVPLSTWIGLVMPGVVKGGVYPYVTRAFSDLGIALLAGFGFDLLTDGLIGRQRSEIGRLLKFFALLIIVLIAVSLLLHANIAALEHGKPGRARLISMVQGIHVLILLLLLSGGAIYWRLRGYLKGSGVA